MFDGKRPRPLLVATRQMLHGETLKIGEWFELSWEERGFIAECRIRIGHTVLHLDAGDEAVRVFAAHVVNNAPPTTWLPGLERLGQRAPARRRAPRAKSKKRRPRRSK